MKHHKVYFEFFGLDKASFVPCEMCMASASEIHHLKFRSQGGGDEIENLAAVCKMCHYIIHNRPGGMALNELLKAKHKAKIDLKNNDKK